MIFIAERGVDENGSLTNELAFYQKVDGIFDLIETIPNKCFKDWVGSAYEDEFSNNRAVKGSALTLSRFKEKYKYEIMMLML